MVLKLDKKKKRMRIFTCSLISHVYGDSIHYIMYLCTVNEILPAAQLHFRGRNVCGAFPGRRDNAVFTGRDGPRLLGGGWGSPRDRRRKKKKKKNYTKGGGGGGGGENSIIGWSGGPEVLLRDVTGHEIRHHVTGALL